METYPLENLLSLDILQSTVQIPDFLHNICNLALVLALNRAGLSNCQIQSQLDTANGLAAKPAAVTCCVRWREADHVVARIGGREGEAAGRLPLAVYYTLVAVEDFLWANVSAGGQGIGLGGR